MRINPVRRRRHHGKPNKPPEKRPKIVLFGEKKRHTVKTQVLMERNTMKIIAVHEAKGSEQCIRRASSVRALSNSIPLDADRGYGGIEH
jgi:hypothetical protein